MSQARRGADLLVTLGTADMRVRYGRGPWQFFKWLADPFFVTGVYLALVALVLNRPGGEPGLSVACAVVPFQLIIATVVTSLDSTRARARLLQEMANGTLVTDGWRSEEVRESLDLCLSCKGCAVNCPAGVDMATYKAEFLDHHYAGRLRPRSHYLLGWLPRWSRLAALAPRVVNGLLRVPGAAHLARAAGGVDQRRPLPRFAHQTFRAWFGRRPAAQQPGGGGEPGVRALPEPGCGLASLVVVDLAVGQS